MMLNAFKSPFLMKAFYCAINGLASLMLMKVFLFFFDIVGHVQQWCIKRAKMKTTDDDGNYMFQFLRFFLTRPTRFDGLFIDEIKREIKQLRHLQLVIERQRVSLWISCMRAPVKMF